MIVHTHIYSIPQYQYKFLSHVFPGFYVILKLPYIANDNMAAINSAIVSLNRLKSIVSNIYYVT